MPELKTVTTVEDQAGAGHAAEVGQQAATGTETVTTETAANLETDEGADGKGTFTPEQQVILDKRIGKEVAKTRTAIEKATATETELAKMKTAVEGNIPLHPDWAGQDDLPIIRKANALEKEIVVLKKHYKDGIEDDEHPENNRTPEEIQQRYAAATAELASVSEKANAAYAKSQKQFVEDAKAGKKLREQKEAAARKAAEQPEKKLDPGASPLSASGAKPGAAATAKPGAKLQPGVKRTALQLMDAI